jgi:hypothetical protein
VRFFAIIFASPLVSLLRHQLDNLHCFETGVNRRFEAVSTRVSVPSTCSFGDRVKQFKVCEKRENSRVKSVSFRSKLIDLGAKQAL